MLDAQRALPPAISGAATNPPPERIRALEGLAARQQEVLDMFGPFGDRLAEAVEPSQQAAVAPHLAALRDSMEETRTRLEEADPSAATPAARTAHGLYLAWKAVADYGWPCGRISRARVTRSPSRPDWPPAAWTPPHGALPLPNRKRPPNSPGYLWTDSPRPCRKVASRPPPTRRRLMMPIPLSRPADVRETILDLARETVRMQNEAVRALQEQDPAAAVHLQQESYDALKEIERLLPRESQDPSQSQQDQQQQQDSGEQKDQQDDRQQEQKDDQEQQPGSEDETGEGEQEEQDTQPADETGDDHMPPEEVETILQRATDRERDYQREKQRRAYRELAPGARDW
jgi:hypothetical protein